MKPHVVAWLLLVLISMSFVVLGYQVAERQGLLFGFIASGLLCFYVLFFEDQVILHSFDANLLEGQDPWGLLQMVSEISEKARISVPQVYVINLSTPTALALGRNWRMGRLLLSSGLLEKLSEEELESTIAILVSQIAAQQTYAKSVGATLVYLVLLPGRLLDALFNFLIRTTQNVDSVKVFQLLFDPLAFAILKITNRSSFYYLTDRRAADLTGGPDRIAKLLWKLDEFAATQPFSVGVNNAHLFIVNPLTRKERHGYLQRLPPIEKRIQNLIGRYPI